MKRIFIVLLIPLLLSGCGKQSITYDWSSKEGDIAFNTTTYRVEVVRALNRIAVALEKDIREDEK